MQFNDFLSAALGIVSIATLAGLGFLRGAVVNLREQLADSRAENKSLKDSRVEDRAEVARLKTDLAALTRVVTGEAHWVAIGDKLDEHHTQAMKHWAVLSEIRDDLRGEH